MQEPRITNTLPIIHIES